MMDRPRIGSLCSGYAGLDLAVEAFFGGETAWFCEYDDAPSRILTHHWPDVPNHSDVTTVDWSQVEPIDILTAGYPCQPFSHAGKRKGAADARHIWPDVARAIGDLRPRVVVLENVRGHVSLGLDAVVGDLAALGYDARWGVVRAADAGAAHGRARVFIVAFNAAESGLQGDSWRGLQSSEPGPRREPATDACTGPQGRESAQRRDVPTRGVDWGVYTAAINRWADAIGRPAPEPTEPGRNDTRRLSPRFVEWLMGLDEGHVTSPEIGLGRNAQLKALGNGVVPQQAMLALHMLVTG